MGLNSSVQSAVNGGTLSWLNDFERQKGHKVLYASVCVYIYSTRPMN